MEQGTTLLLGLPGVRVWRVEQRCDGARVVHVVTADPAAAVCPGCGVVSSSGKQNVATRPRDIPYVNSGPTLVLVLVLAHIS